MIKNIVKYIFILIAIAVGVCAIACAIMMFVPNVSILGYRYINLNQKFEQTLHTNSAIKSYVEHANEIVSIEINAENVDVMVMPAMSKVYNGNYGFIQVSSVMQGNGFCKTNKDAKLVKELFYTKVEDLVRLDDGKYKLIITNKTAEGLVNLTYKKLELQIPNDMAENLRDLTIITKTGRININQNKDVENAKISVSNNTTLESTTGDISVNYLKTKNIKVKSYRGEIDFSSELKDIGGGNTILGTTWIESEFGHVNFASGVNLSNVKITSGISKIKLNDITESLEYEGDSAYLDIGKVTGGVTIKSNNASINIKELAKLPHKADTLFYITNIVESEKSLGDLRFKIGKADTNEINLQTNYGDITINELVTNNATNSGKCNLVSNSGNITVANLLGDIQAISTSGNIKINQATYDSYDDIAYEEILKNSKIIVKATKGNVVLKNIVGELNLDVTNNGNAPVDIEFLEINKNSTISAGKGNLHLYMPTLFTDGTKNIYNIAFFKIVGGLKIVSSANIGISLSGLTEVNDKEQYYYVQAVKYNESTSQNEFYGENMIDGYPLVTIYSQSNKITIEDIANKNEAN